MTHAQYEILIDYLRPSWTAWQSDAAGRKRIKTLVLAGWINPLGNGVENGTLVVTGYGRSAMRTYLARHGMTAAEIDSRVPIKTVP